MGALLADLRNFKSIILESFLDGLTPVECALRLVQNGFHPPPTDDELKDGSTFLETVKQVLIDEFYVNGRVKELKSYWQLIMKMDKGMFEVLEHVLRENENLIQWLPRESLGLLKDKFGFQITPHQKSNQ
jgi:histone deacetylase complex regulatory component SIN3